MTDLAAADWPAARRDHQQVLEMPGNFTALSIKSHQARPSHQIFRARGLVNPHSPHDSHVLQTRI
jgi:hypothetical protein